MAAGRAPANPADEARQFVLGALVGMLLMVAIVLVTLYGLGHLFPAADHIDGAVAPSEEVLVDKPTPVWRFRAEWLTPAAGR